MDNTLQARLYDQLDKAPDKQAIAFYSSRDEFAWCTREQFHTQAARYAARLADYGLSQGDVSILVLPSAEFCATMIVATLLLGAVPLLIAPPFLQEQGGHSSLLQILVGIIGKTNPRLVICPESLLEMREDLEKERSGSRFLFGERDLAVAATDAIPVVMPAETAVAAMQLTSGTTSFPRICLWRQRNVLAALDGMVTAMKLSREDICLNWTPLYHDMGLVNNFMLCLTSGTPLVMLSPNDFVMKPALWLRALSRTGATVTWSPNFGFALAAQRVRDSEIEGVRLDRVHAFWNAAERIHLETMREFHERFAPHGVRFEALKTNFGCAENVGGATFSDPDGAFVVERVARTPLQEERIAKPVAEAEGEAETVTVVGVGRPFPGMGVNILSEAGDPLPDGHVGEVALETPSRMMGYLGDPEATGRALYGKLLRTGDLGYTRAGELFWVGRVHERINIRGVKVDPSDFEPILLHVSGLRQGCFVAFGVDDKRQGTQRLVIVSEVRDSTERKPEEIAGEISRQILQQLGLRADDILLVRPGTLTKTSSGKRRHRHFRQLYLQGKLKAFAWQLEEI